MFNWSVRDVAPPIHLAALDALRANVMIADDDLNITSMNASAAALMRKAEADLKRDLPQFDASSLIGRNVDIFHKSPPHQRTMLAKMSKPHAATIRVGPRIFDLLVTPLTDKGARRGFVVEWSDARYRLQNLDFAGQIASIHRYQTAIEFDVDGNILTANENFLAAMGYRLDEIHRRHQSMFVEPGHEKTQEYKDHWAALRRGEYRATKFRRFAKGRQGHLDRRCLQPDHQ